MNEVRSIFDFFLGHLPQDLVIEEDFSEFKASASGDVLAALNAQDFDGKSHSLNQFDWTVSVKFANQDSPHSIARSTADDLGETLRAIAYAATIGANARIAVYFRKPIDKVIFVISPSDLFRWIASLSLPDCIEQFSELFQNRTSLTFFSAVFSETATESILFTSNPSAAHGACEEDLLKRQALIKSRREQTVSDWHTHVFPDDFRWKKGARISGVAETFSRLENFLAIVSLADSTTATEKGFKLEIKGNVLREQVLKWSQVPNQSDIPLQGLFEWCYRGAMGGGLSDRLGLVRNYISLYWDSGIFKQDLRVISAVRAGFALFLKKNLKEFVDIRAKVSTFILELDAKAAKSLDTATGNLEKNVYGVVTFVTSVVLLKALQDKTFSGAFSPQIAILGWILIGFSCLHATLSWKIITQDLDRYSELYDDLKVLHGAFFSPSEFDSIFSSSGKTPMQKTKDYVFQRRRLVLGVWIVILIVAAFLIWYLRTDPTVALTTQSPPAAASPKPTVP